MIWGAANVAPYASLLRRIGWCAVFRYPAGLPENNAGTIFQAARQPFETDGGPQALGARVGDRTKWGSLSASKNVVDEILYYSVRSIFSLLSTSFCSICRPIFRRIKTLPEKIFWTVIYTTPSNLFLPLFSSVDSCLVRRIFYMIPLILPKNKRAPHRMSAVGALYRFKRLCQAISTSPWTTTLPWQIAAAP